jgi:hypothetical protein
MAAAKASAYHCRVSREGVLLITEEPGDPDRRPLLVIGLTKLGAGALGPAAEPSNAEPCG